MPYWRKPSPDSVQRFLALQAKLDFSYPAVGATSATPPAGYVVDHTRVRVGNGERAFEVARAALARWEHFRLGWVQAHPAADGIRVGGMGAGGARAVRPSGSAGGWRSGPARSACRG